ncbi:MAG: hypothetical protein JWO08_528 [Verrucomicrobiaceae bacterium]|nr:hypothetical protein [Verrucomicrobiaceae bacterium]
MKTLILFWWLAVAMALQNSIVQGQAVTTVVPSVAAAPDGFIVVKGVIYTVHQKQAAVLPDSLRWTGTTQGVPGFPRAIQELQSGFMLTTEGKVVVAPPDIVLVGNAVGTIAPVNDTDNSIDNSSTRSTDNPTDNSSTRSTDNSTDNRTTRATSNATDNRTTRSTNNATDNSTTNGSPR